MVSAYEESPRRTYNFPQSQIWAKEELFARIKANSAFDLVVTDVHLQDTQEPNNFWEIRMDGYEVAKQAVNLGIRAVIASLTDTPSRKVEGAPMYNKNTEFEQVFNIVQELTTPVDGKP